MKSLLIDKPGLPAPTVETIPKPVDADSSMAEVLRVYPGAQRALFRRYHIGGCSSCGFQPTETVRQLCERNGLVASEILEFIAHSHEEDLKLLMAPEELDSYLQERKPFHLLDIRTREEWNTAHIEGAVLFSQTLMQEMLAKWSRDTLLVIYDHQGKQSLDAAAYFGGQGFKNVRCLSGGIDAWAQQVDSTIPRYRVE